MISSVLFGSTQKMGSGTNVQEPLIALHHLNAPWRPADVEQREGRILRQGNRNAVVNAFRYVTEGSFDASVVSHKRLDLFSLIFAHSWSSTARFNLLKGLPAAIQFLDNGLDGGCPYEGLGVGIPRGEELVDGLFQILDADEHPTTKPFARQFSKPTLDQIQPTGTGGNEVRDEAGMPPEPVLHSGMFVRAVVVHHHMQL